MDKNRTKIDKNQPKSDKNRTKIDKNQPKSDKKLTKKRIKNDPKSTQNWHKYRNN